MRTALTWLFIVILGSLWALGVFTGHTFDGTIHVLLLGASFLLISQLVVRNT